MRQCPCCVFMALPRVAEKQRQVSRSTDRISRFRERGGQHGTIIFQHQMRKQFHAVRLFGRLIPANMGISLSRVLRSRRRHWRKWFSKGAEKAGRLFRFMPERALQPNKKDVPWRRIYCEPTLPPTARLIFFSSLDIFITPDCSVSSFMTQPKRF